MYRVEDKYILPRSKFFELSRRMETILPIDGNSPDGYSISSLYFDDFRDRDYYDTVSGNPERRKYRIRIYNDSLKTIKLEVKHKRYSRIQKVSERISEKQMRDLMGGRPIEPSNNLDDASTQFFLAQETRLLRPKVIVTYERKAYLYQSGTVRITFDDQVRASRQLDKFGEPDLVCDFPQQRYILEVKYNEFIPDFILQALEIDGMERTAYSKYGICRELYM